jgi:hypothetical protein
MTCGVNPFFLKVPTGKRKVGAVRVVDNEETRQKMVRHPKNNGERFFDLRDEEDKINDGLGIVGTVSQPLRPI